MSKGKERFETGSVAKKFLSNISEEAPIDRQESDDRQDKSEVTNDPISDKSYFPVGKETGENRPKRIDKKTGEVTKQMGYFVTVSQDK